MRSVAQANGELPDERVAAAAEDGAAVNRL